MLPRLLGVLILPNLVCPFLLTAWNKKLPTWNTCCAGFIRRHPCCPFVIRIDMMQEAWLLIYSLPINEGIFFEYESRAFCGGWRERTRIVGAEINSLLGVNVKLNRRICEAASTSSRSSINLEKKGRFGQRIVSFIVNFIEFVKTNMLSTQLSQRRAR